MNNIELLLEEIDKAHQLANNALKNRMFEEYINFFGDELKYKQLNGKTIGKASLANDIKLYFNRILNYTSSYDRLSFTLEKDTLIEELIQHLNISLKVFVFFSKNWKVQRKGIYQWKNINNEWKIVVVEILEEKLNNS
ncbi:MAG: hypothetical protein JWP94_988 [Mucilaginibacter sp.]|jgi:hypothetical protein|nr:hypothetical protein [Mucilaginibacter sp.]